jgi:hypothetical protein
MDHEPGHQSALCDLPHNESKIRQGERRIFKRVLGSHPFSAMYARENCLSPGAPRGNRNAFKHGRYAAEAVADRRKMAALIRVMKSLARAAIED